MRKNNIENCHDSETAGTWKFTANTQTPPGDLALVLNPYSVLGHILINKLTDKNLTVLISSNKKNIRDQSINFSDNPLIRLLPDEPPLNFPQRFLYFIVFCWTVEDIETFISLTQDLPIETKKILIASLEIGLENITNLPSRVREKVVIVPPGFNAFPFDTDRVLFFKILSSLVSSHKVLLNPNDSSDLSFSSFEELTSNILKILFTGQKGLTHWLIPHPLNLSTGVALIQNNLATESQLPVGFHPQAPVFHQQILLPPDVPYWTPTTSYEQAIRETFEILKSLDRKFYARHLTFLTENVEEKEKLPAPQKKDQEPPPTKENAPLRQIRNPLHKPFKLLITTFAVFVAIVFLYLTVTLWEFYRSIQDASAGPDHASEAIQSAIAATKKIVLLDQAITILKKPFQKIGLGELHQKLFSQISSIEILSYAEISTLRLVQNLDQQSSVNNASSLRLPQLESGLGEEITNLALAHTALDSDLSWLKRLPTLGQKVQQTDLYLSKIRSGLVYGQKLFPYLDTLVFTNQSKKYLILFQNSMELRPTGGFVGSYGLVTVNKSRIVSLEVKDVYAADGQLKGHVEPPKPIKNVLNEAGWKLRDSNWDPDFPTSAVRAQWFLEKETGETVDGTIGVTLKLAQEILNAIGPVKLDNYQETISKENLFEKAQYHAEGNFFPGSTQKKDFLGALAQAILVKSQKLSAIQSVKLLATLDQTLKERDLQFYFNNGPLQSAINEIGLDGKIAITKNCRTPNCVDDTLFFIDSNLGVNKANYALEKKYLDRISLNPNGEILHHFTAVFTNTAGSESWPLGVYKSYFRLYLPPGSVISQISIRDPFTSHTENISDTDHTKEHGFDISGFSFIVPIKQSREIEIRYRTASRLDVTNSGTYFLSLRKQAGTSDDPFQIVFDGPQDVVLTPGSPPPDSRPKSFDLSNAVGYNLFMSSDKTLTYEIRPKR